MPLDLGAISAASREEYIAVGRRFGSSNTLKQAKKTLNGLSKHGALLVPAGFAASDEARLRELADLLVAAGVDREGSRAGRKTTSAALRDATRVAQDARLTVRAILERAREVLLERGDHEAARKVGVVLRETSEGTDHPEALAAQLDVLRGLLETPPVAEVAAERGGPEALETALATATALRAADTERTVPAGTPAATERLDLIDGMIVSLVRAARRASRPAARAAGNPALLADFELDELYSSRQKAEAPEPVA